MQSTTDILDKLMPKIGKEPLTDHKQARHETKGGEGISSPQKGKKIERQPLSAIAQCEHWARPDDSTWWGEMMARFHDEVRSGKKS